MAPRKKQPVDLAEARTQMESVKALVISLGLPYSQVRRIDDALAVVDTLEARTKKVS